MSGTLRAPGYVRWVTRTLEEAGYETWAVGGAIRDSLLGLPVGDWDMATQAPPQVVQRLFPRTVPVGIDHGTVGVLTRDGILLEVTTFRRDVQTFGRHAVVEFAQDLHEDLARRDFTVNAVAWHPLREDFQDPFGGRRDLENRVLRTVGDPGARFAEDHLRILRALRFSGRFRLRIHPETWMALYRARDDLLSLSPERVREELMKVLADDARPSGAMALYAAAGVLPVLFPELAALSGCPRPGVPEDLWVHTLLLMDVLPPHRTLLRLAALLHGVGCPGEMEAEGECLVDRARHRAAALLFRCRFSNAEVAEVTELVGMGQEPPVAIEGGPALRRLLHHADPVRLPDLGRLWLGKARLDRMRWGTDPGSVVSLIRRLRNELIEGPPLRLGDLALDGRDLIAMGLEPGPRFGEILRGLMDRVLDDPGLNRKELLMGMVKAEVAGSGEGA